MLNREWFNLAAIAVERCGPWRVLSAACALDREAGLLCLTRRGEKPRHLDVSFAEFGTDEALIAEIARRVVAFA